METIERAKNLTRQLITFAKGGAPRRETGNLASIVKDALEKTVKDTDISLCVDASPALHPVSFDGEQIGQTVECVGLNAIEAMQGRGG
ncbi:MAG: hypothetical protein JXX14_16535 [Deltaproteobacteria bacterium]|nr:hypothetical protein [Deltaproteobacteria bacterium]